MATITDEEWGELSPENFDTTLLARHPSRREGAQEFIQASATLTESVLDDPSGLVEEAAVRLLSLDDPSGEHLVAPGGDCRLDQDIGISQFTPDDLSKFRRSSAPLLGLARRCFERKVT